VPFCLSAFLPFCLSAFLPFCLSAFLPFCLSAFLPFCRFNTFQKQTKNTLTLTLSHEARERGQEGDLMTEKKRATIRHSLLPQGTLDRARELRRQMTVPERALWNLLRGRQMADLKFRRQHPIGPYFADFCCEEVRLIVELDGDSHIGRAETDERRTQFLNERGFQVLRIGNDDVLEDPESVAHAILRAAGKPIPQ
jgi:very-short-patch-repair endonuclease